MLQRLRKVLNKNEFIIKTRKIIKKVIRKIIQKALHIFGYVVFIPLSFLVPKSNYVVLTSRFGDFEGNLKYFLQYLSSLDENDVEFVFLTEKKDVYQALLAQGYTVWLYPRLSTIIKMLQTGTLIVDGNEWAKNLKNYLLFKADKVQLWHGTGLKTIGLLKPAIKNLPKVLQVLKKEYTFYKLLMLTSQFQVETRSKAFRYETLLINGYPRNDLFFNHDCDSELGCDSLLLAQFMQYKKEGYRLVTYTPTWRKFAHDLNHLDLPALDQFAQNNRIIFILKLHPKHDCMLNNQVYTNIVEYDKVADVYPLLAITDLLITDYSSIYLDFLLLDKPILFFPYDNEEYIGGERALLLDYDEITPGPKCYEHATLMDEIYKHVVEAEDHYQPKRTKLRQQFFQHKDGKSSERLWRAIKTHVLKTSSGNGTKTMEKE